jgi:hypothetical protein
VPRLQVGIRTIEQLVVKLLSPGAEHRKHRYQYERTAFNHTLITHPPPGLLPDTRH